MENQLESYKSQTLDLQLQLQEQGFELQDTSKRLVETLDRIQVSDSMYQDKLNHLKSNYTQSKERESKLNREREEWIESKRELENTILDLKRECESFKEKATFLHSIQDQNLKLESQIQVLCESSKGMIQEIQDLKIENATLKRQVEVKESLQDEILDEISQKWDIEKQVKSTVESLLDPMMKEWRSASMEPFSPLLDEQMISPSIPTPTPIPNTNPIPIPNTNTNPIPNPNTNQMQRQMQKRKPLHSIDVGLLSPKVALIYLLRQ